MNGLRLASAGCLILPPAINAVLHVIDPLTADSDATLISQAVAHPGLTSVMQLQYVLLLFAPAALVLASIARGSRVFSRVGGAVLCAAGLSAFAGPLQNTVLDVAAHSSNPRSWLEPMRQLGDSAAISAFDVIFILGQLIGFVLLGVAMLRSRAVARWAGWTVIVAAVLDVVGHSVPGQAVIVVSWALLAVGLGGCALTTGPGVVAATRTSADAYAKAA